MEQERNWYEVRERAAQKILAILEEESATVQEANYIMQVVQQKYMASPVKNSPAAFEPPRSR